MLRFHCSRSPSSAASRLDLRRRIVRNFGEGERRAPFKAYEWNKMKTPTRIPVGGPEVTSGFVLSALVRARSALRRAGMERDEGVNRCGCEYDQ
jgi:hypothetical protein